MAESPSVEEVAEAIFALVREYHGRKRWSAGDLQKEMQAKHGKEGCDRKKCKDALKLLMDSGRCVYGYAGGSYVALHPDHEPR